MLHRFGPACDDSSGTLFDKVWIVSLAASRDRRAYVQEHLRSVGLENFAFFDATPADHPDVEIASANVMQFPPCFRCGSLDCGKPDCNNFLTPQQVACVLTYRRLWRAIADGPHDRVLVVEDDVYLHDWASEVLSFLEREVDEKRIPFWPGQRCLLRLGWAEGADHDQRLPFRVTQEVRTSNPCHALTREFAQALLDRAARINHTADVYQHRLAPRPGEAFTVFPPIASELSWGQGRFASTIHPKMVRADFLRSIGRYAEAEKAAEDVRLHLKKKFFRPLLISGHPRSGTGYAAALCRQLGADVQHEKAGKDGISSWMFAVDTDASPYALDDVARTRRALVWKWLVTPVRDLRAAAPSTIRENQYAPPSYAYRRDHILKQLGVDLDDATSPLDKAVLSLTGWTRILMQQKPALVFRIEDEIEKLRTFLIERGLASPDTMSVVLDTSPVNANKKYKGVVYPKPEPVPEDWLALPASTKKEIEWYCETFGYQPFDH